MTERKRIGLREVRALLPGETVYDSAVPGFGARRQKGAVNYVLRYRTASNRQRWHTIGRHGAPWTPDTARDEARRLLGMVATGADPAAAKREAREAVTMAALCDQYWEDVTSGRLLTRTGRAKKASTLESDKGRIERHIKPLLGRIAVAAVTRQDAESFMHAVAEGKSSARARTGKTRGLSNVRGGRGAATRTMGLLGAILTYAMDRGLRADNPVHRVRKFAENKRERRLSNNEYAALGRALQQAHSISIWPPAVNAILFLALTGWRSGEALALRFDQVDQATRTAILGDTKTGRSVRPLSRATCELLCNQARDATGKLVFPPTRGEGIMAGFRSIWNRIIRLGGLPADVTPHVLRHSFASLAADIGYSEPTIAALMGHKGHSITSRYVHSADVVLLAAADAVAERTAQLMGCAVQGVAAGLPQAAG